MSASLGLSCSCSFSPLTFSQGRRVGSRSLWRQEPRLMTELTTSGSPSPRCGTPPVAKPAPGRERPRLRLVLTLTNQRAEEEEEQELGPPPPPSNLDYLRHIGHCIWIS